MGELSSWGLGDINLVYVSCFFIAGGYMDRILKLFSIDTIIFFLITVLMETIKNPNSAKARRLESTVIKLRDTAEEFLQRLKLARS